MDERRYRLLWRLAAILTIAWIGWTIFDARLQQQPPGADELTAAGRYLEDGQLADAWASFDRAQRLDPHNRGILRGQALTQMRIGNQHAAEALQLRDTSQPDAAEIKEQLAQHAYQTALELYNEAIAREQGTPLEAQNRTALGVSLANRGILKDRMGDYSGALADYQQAVTVEPEVADGPGFITRFLRNQAQRPPTVSDRMHYLERELSKPQTERMLRVPELDAQQRSYRMD